MKQDNSNSDLSWRKSKSSVVNNTSLYSPSEKISSPKLSDNDIWKAKNLDKLQYSNFSKLHKRF